MSVSLLPHTFSGLALHRCEHERKVTSWVEEQLNAATTRLLLFDSANSILWNPKPATCFISQDLLPDAGWRHLLDDAVLLGRTKNEHALSVAARRFSSSSIAGASTEELRNRGWEWINLRKFLVNHDDPQTVALVGLGNSLSLWNTNYQYCGRCGTKSTSKDGGYSRECGECKNKEYPRINPCAIMLVEDGNGRCLLGRGKGMPFFSTLAGYASHGESIEETVAREVEEETGVRVNNVRYHSSQSWPFPYQLMLGFFATADPTGTTIKIDPIEMDDAQWFTSEDVRQALAGDHPTLVVPPSFSIAHQLMKAWVAECPTLQHRRDESHL